MNSFFDRIRYKYMQFMRGRYGFDELSKKMIIWSLIFFTASVLIRGLWFLYPVGCVLVMWSYFRCFSKNVYKRSKELIAYNGFLTKNKKKLALLRRIWKERKTYKYFRCKNCGAFWRVPRGIGTTEIKCKICKEKMIRKA